MPIPQIHNEFFHAFSHLEPMVRIWAEDNLIPAKDASSKSKMGDPDPIFKGRSLADMFPRPVPSIATTSGMTFGEYTGRIADLIQKFGGSIRIHQKSLCSVLLSSNDIYAFSLEILNRSCCHAKDLKQLTQLTPIAMGLVEVMHTMIDVEHSEPRVATLSDTFMRSAMANMRRVSDDFDRFDREKGMRAFETAKKKILPCFSMLPGAFQDEMTRFGTHLEGMKHGQSQANRFRYNSKKTESGPTQ
jgi:hypothetical protein